jgi:serine/threonine protein kinase
LGPAPGPPTAPGRIGEFELLEVLGEGTFGRVFLARQASLGRQVALKVTRQGAVGLAEGRVLAGLEHDHIVKVFSGFEDPDTGTSGVCLQYVPGATLGAVIRHAHAAGHPPASGRAILDALDALRRGQSAFDPAALRDRDALAGDDFPQAVCRIGARLAEALAFAHATGVLHCDIKPGNILLTPYGRPMLADFNVAFDRARRSSPGGGLGGTVAYMAPEHKAAARGLPGARVDERSDVYSLGVVLHELATGGRPPRIAEHPGGGNFSGAEELNLNPPDPLKTVPRELAAVIRRCLEPDPTNRYPTAGDLAAALEAARQLLDARRALPPAGRVGRWVARHPVPALALAAFLPHLAASAVNIGYNAVEIRLSPAQERTFFGLVVGYNLIVYPLVVAVVVRLLWKLARGLRAVETVPGPRADEARKRARRLGWWAIGLAAAGWLPGGLLFPLVIDLVAGPVPWQTYAHFAVSFTLAGLVGVVFSYLAIQAVLFRAVFPRLGNPDTFTPAGMWAELRPLTAPFAPFLVLACAVPLTGAVLLVAFADGVMTLGFRVLVTGLIGLGVVGIWVAERLVRHLRALAAVWHRDGG